MTTEHLLCTGCPYTHTHTHTRTPHTHWGHWRKETENFCPNCWSTIHDVCTQSHDVCLRKMSTRFTPGGLTLLYWRLTVQCVWGIHMDHASKPLWVTNISRKRIHFLPWLLSVSLELALRATAWVHHSRPWALKGTWVHFILVSPTPKWGLSKYLLDDLMSPKPKKIQKSFTFSFLLH